MMGLFKSFLNNDPCCFFGVYLGSDAEKCSSENITDTSWKFRV